MSHSISRNVSVIPSFWARLEHARLDASSALTTTAAIRIFIGASIVRLTLPPGKNRDNVERGCPDRYEGIDRYLCLIGAIHRFQYRALHWCRRYCDESYEHVDD